MLSSHLVHKRRLEKYGNIKGYQSLRQVRKGGQYLQLLRGSVGARTSETLGAGQEERESLGVGFCVVK